MGLLKLNEIPLIDTLLFGNIVFQLCFGYVLLNKEIYGNLM